MNIIIYFWGFVYTLFYSPICNFQKINPKVINLAENIRIILPLKNEFDENNNYMHIQIWLFNKKLYEDTSKTEYLFDNKEWPKAFKVNDRKYLIYLKVFDAPDFNKIYQFTISNYKVIRKDILPYFYEPPLTINSQKVYFGTLNIVEPPCDNCDSCFYNPRLYYEMTDKGLILDSNLTIHMNKKIWAGFFGFNIRLDIIKPCK